MQARRRALVVCFACVACGLLALTYAATQLALHRVYQVDELENAYSASVIARGEAGEVYANAALFVLALRPIAATSLSSAQLLDTYRLLFLGLCMLNAALLFRALRLPPRSMLATAGLLLVVTLPSLWTFGYEVRHDNVILAGLLLSLLLLSPVRDPLPLAYAWLGAIAVLAQACAFKAFLYWVPLTAAALLFPSAVHRQASSRLRLATQFLLGALLAGGCVLALHLALGTLETYLGNLRGGARVSEEVRWKDHTPALVYLASQAPLLVLVVPLACVRIALGVKRDARGYLAWSSSLPALACALVAFVIFLVNPTPFHYNFVPLCAGLLLGLVALLRELHERLRSTLARGVLLACVLAGQLVPFLPTAQRLQAASNARQRLLMSVAEQLTDAEHDRVYAASGLVPTRRSIGRRWFLHSLNLTRFYDGTYPTVRSMLESRPASVLVPNYRTDWLTDDDRATIMLRYVPLADDLWVLGRFFYSGSGTFDCIHPGRYRITAGKAGASLDGVPLRSHVVELSRGLHQFRSNSRVPLLVHWLGPHLGELPRLPQSSHHDVFAYDF